MPDPATDPEPTPLEERRARTPAPEPAAPNGGPAQPRADRGEADPIEELVFEALVVLEDGGGSALDALLERHADHASEVRRRVEILADLGVTPGPKTAAFTIPERVGGYVLGARLGEGGMGVVFEARDTAVERRVAVKLVRPAVMPEGEARGRFEREARAVAGLRHPGVVRVFDVGEDAGVPWLAMEWLDGCTVADLLDAFRGRRPESLDGLDVARVVRERATERPERERAEDAWRGPWPAVCARVVRRAAEAVHAAHEAGILHRDVKPSNVALTPHGRIVLLDFGLARATDDVELTRTGALVGSLPYAPPERVESDAPASVASDVYGLGVLLYEMLALDLPFRAGSRAGLVERIAEASPRPVGRRNAAVGRGLARVVARAMHRDPERRHRTALDLAHDLDAVLSGRAPDAPGDGVWAALGGWWRARPLEVAAAVVGLLALGIALPLTLRAQADAAERAARAEGLSLDRLDATLRISAALQEALPDYPALGGSTYDRLRREVLAKIVELRAPLFEALPAGALEPLVEAARTAQDAAIASLAGRGPAPPDPRSAALLRALAGSAGTTDRARVEAALLLAEAASRDGRADGLEEALAEIDAAMGTTPELIGALRARAALLEELCAAAVRSGDVQGAARFAERAFADRERLAAAFPGAPALVTKLDAWSERGSELQRKGDSR